MNLTQKKDLKFGVVRGVLLLITFAQRKCSQNSTCYQELKYPKMKQQVFAEFNKFVINLNFHQVVEIS